MVKFKRLISIILVLVISLSLFAPSVSAKKSNAKVASAKNVSKDLGAEIAAYAKSYIGHRYVFGAAGPNVFDCSGFVKYVYGHFGYSFPHTAAYYQNFPSKYGKYVSASEAKPGDIVSWKGHVGIYIGNGKVVNALSPRHGVCETTIATFHNRHGVCNPPHLYLRVDPPKPDKKTKVKNNSYKLGDEAIASLKAKQKYVSVSDANCCMSQESSLWKFDKLGKGNKYIIGDVLSNHYLAVSYNESTGEYNLHVSSNKKDASTFKLEKAKKNVKIKDKVSGLYISCDKKSNNLILSKKATAFKLKQESFLINDIEKPADLLKTAQISSYQEIKTLSDDRIDDLNNLEPIESLKPHIITK